MTTGGDGDDTDYREILNRTIRKLTSLKLQILDDRNLTEREIGRKIQAALDDVEHFRLGHNRPDVRAHNSQTTQALIRAVRSGKVHYQQQQQQEEAPCQQTPDSKQRRTTSWPSSSCPSPWSYSAPCSETKSGTGSR